VNRVHPVLKHKTPMKPVAGILMSRIMEALKWLPKAADQGDAEAQRLFGIMYYEGQGVSKNLIEAKNWFGMAAANGDQEALSMMKKLRKWSIERILGDFGMVGEIDRIMEEQWKLYKGKLL